MNGGRQHQQCRAHKRADSNPKDLDADALVVSNSLDRIKNRILDLPLLAFDPDRPFGTDQHVDDGEDERDGVKVGV